MLLPVVQEESYLCPGELYPVSRAVHLARLAAFYPNCRECSKRHEAGHLTTQTLEQIETTTSRIERATLFTDTGVRGVYLNELTAQTAGRMAEAFAHVLWEQTPLRVTAAEPSEALIQRTRRLGPHVIIGRDERPAALDLVTGVAKSLRRMGCQVTDVGLVTRACFWQAVVHLQGAGGLHVTGAGCDPAWIGLDFVMDGAVPVTRESRLRDIETVYQAGTQRPLRNSAPLRTFHAGQFYEASLWKHFHALRPLRVVCGSANQPLAALIQRIFQKLACRLIPVPIPVRSRDLTAVTDPDLHRIRQAVFEQQAHLGVLMDADGQTCAVIDEQGLLRTGAELTWFLASHAAGESPAGAVVLEAEALGQEQRPIRHHTGAVVTSSADQGAMARHMRDQSGIFGGGPSGRFWFREPFPTCDAVLTLAKLLQALSHSDQELSERLSGA